VGADIQWNPFSSHILVQCMQGMSACSALGDDWMATAWEAQYAKLAQVAGKERSLRPWFGVISCRRQIACHGIQYCGGACVADDMDPQMDSRALLAGRL
jgi:hypothetical protein